MFSLPKGFAIAFENARSSSYIREAIPFGENLQKWSQMITINGTKGPAPSPDFTPQVFAANIVSGFKNACPDTFSGTRLGNFKVGNHDALAVFAGCGKLNAAGDAFSESALIFVIKGENDYYTLQWAERGPALETPMTYDANKWNARAKQLMPIKLCPIVPGEPEPYSSCSGFKP